VLTTEQLAELKAHTGRDRNRLGKAMSLAGLTQVVVAERTGFTQSYVSRVQSGRYQDLPGETMRAFADLFGCAIEDLFPARQAVA
jgi:transcriptional regulator with XRE-family HTH domain